jgi:outer membrane protein OmpA-like peptidoglycan-associated protein
MNPRSISLVLLAAFIAIPAFLVIVWLGSAKSALNAAPEAAANVPLASAAEDEYCTPKLKQILRRVAGACGLIQEGGRGCKPADARSVAQMSGDDFNALFGPLSHRARIIQFDSDEVVLDPEGQSAVDAAWAEQKGASFFFVVSRASADGNATHNQELSQARAEAVLTHITAKDADFRSQVGLLWLGEEYAQLSDEYCTWKRSRSAECTSKEINRSAFVAWIDCAI